MKKLIALVLAFLMVIPVILLVMLILTLFKRISRKNDERLCSSLRRAGVVAADPPQGRGRVNAS